MIILFLLFYFNFAITSTHTLQELPHLTHDAKTYIILKS